MANRQGGVVIFAPSETAAVLNATQAFYDNNRGAKAQIITTVNGALTGSSTLVLFFYDGPDRPASFDAFHSIPYLVNDVKTQSFSDFVSNIPSELAQVANVRGTFDTISTTSLTAGFITAVKNETDVCAPNTPGMAAMADLRE